MAYPRDPDWKPGRFTELRVHGVGNTPLEQILDDPNPVRVIGDATAGFYRRPGFEPSTTQPPIDDKGALVSPGDLEAYDWGGFNTGGGWRAFWVLLLPFTLVNLAGWMVLNRSRLGRRSVQLFGLALSTALVAWLGAVAVDTIALQCGGQTTCVDHHVWMKPLDWFGSDPAARIAIVLIIPLVIVLLLRMWPGGRSQNKYELFAGSREFYDEVYMVAGREWTPPGDEAQITMQDPDLWDHEDAAAPDLHAAAAIAVLGAGVGWGLWSAAGRVFDLVMGIAGIALFLVIAAALTFWHDGRRGRRSRPDGGLARFSSWMLAVALCLVTVTIVAGFALDRGLEPRVDLLGSTPAEAITSTGRSFAEFDAIRVGMYRSNAFTIAGVLALAVVGMLFHHLVESSRVDRRRPGKRMLWGWGPLAASMAALALVATMVVGVSLWLAEFLGDRPEELMAAAGIDRATCETLGGSEEVCGLINQTTIPLDQAADRLQELLSMPVDAIDQLPLMAALASVTEEAATFRSQPLIYLGTGADVLALGVLGFLVLVALGFGVIWVVIRFRLPRSRFPIRDELRQVSDEAFAGRSEAEEKHWRKAGIRELRKSPRNTRLPMLLLIPLVLATAGIVVAVWTAGQALLLRTVIKHATWLITLAAAVIVAAAAAVGLLIWRSYKPAAQESFGGMWDVLTFWPRRFHPFAVPSFTVRAVPELAARIKTLTPRGHRVLLTAHSGGVMVAIAAVLLLPEANRRRVSLLTYGSPTGSLQGPAYPEFIDEAELMKIALMLRHGRTGVRWINLWRLTDWTGGYAFGPVSDRYRDPTRGLERPIDPQGTWSSAKVGTIDGLQFDPNVDSVRNGSTDYPVPLAIGHTDYFHDPKWVGPEDERFRTARRKLVGYLYR